MVFTLQSQPQHSEQIARKAYIYLALSLIALCLPHLLRSSLVLVPTLLFCVVWRYLHYYQKVSLPNTALKVLFIAVALALIFASHRSLITLEAISAFLLVTLLLKFLEMKNLRDVLLLCYLGFFCTLLQILFSQDIASTIYTFVCLSLLVAALIAVYQDDSVAPNAAFKSGLKMALCSLPLMMLIFLVFPRIGPLWSIPNYSKVAQTGISDRMMPGDIEQISDSNALAFRVEFLSDNAPPANDMYWRGLTLEQFDGQGWQATSYYVKQRLELNPKSVDANADLVNYRLYMQPSFRHWFFVLDRLVKSDTGVFFDDRTLTSGRKPIGNLEVMHLISQLNYKAKNERDAVLKTNLDLPQGFNPNVSRWAQDLYASAASDQAFAEAILVHIQTEPFVYTNKPGRYGRNSIDEFWFERRRGFCEHYAQAMTVMFRAVGIPARVVTGYYGAELNPNENYWMVRQKDAHAWLEAWIFDPVTKKASWQRFDPTAAINPARVEVDSFSTQNQRLFGAAESQGKQYTMSLLTSLRYKADHYNYLWQKAVMNFDSAQQSQVLKNLLGAYSPLKLGLLIAAGFALIFGLFQLSQLRFQQRTCLSDEIKLYHQFIAITQKQGVAYYPGITPDTLTQRFAENASVPDEAGAIASAFTQLFISIEYRELDANHKAEAMDDLRLLLKQLRAALK